MLNRVTATVEKYGLLEKGDSVIVALSGGADSTALLSVFVSLKENTIFRFMPLISTTISVVMRQSVMKISAKFFVRNLTQNFS